MTGVYLLLVLGLWSWLCMTVARWLSPLAHRWLRWPLLLVLLPLPLADEIYSRTAFKRMCEAHAEVELLHPQLAGKTIWFTGVSTRPLRFGLLTGLEKQWNYVLAESETPAFRHYTYLSQGGWLVRLLGISETTAPLLFESQCEPKNLPSLSRQLDIRILDKPVQR